MRGAYELPRGIPGFIKRRDFPHVKFCTDLWNIRTRTINQLVRNFRNRAEQSVVADPRLLRSAFLTVHVGLRSFEFAPLAIVGLAIVGPAQLLHVHVVGPSDLP